MTEECAAVSDASLVGRARGGDPAAFEALVRRHYRAAWSIAWSVTGNGMDAEDVCQDAFVRALERLDECRRPESFLAWLRTIVWSTALNLIERRKVRDAAPLDAVVEGSGPEADARAARAELRAGLERALAQLPERQREALLLHDLEGMTHAEIAGTIGVSEVNSRQLCFVARRRLREILDPRWVEEALG